jgi:2-polyprenyl-3-methyl-5-hydroxy-6-metoxy-1,4-benzoquinol methylase
VTEQPGYHDFVNMDGDQRFQQAVEFAGQALTTTGPWLAKPPEELDVLDLGCGYGDMAAELAKTCRHVTAVEPTTKLVETGRRTYGAISNLTIQAGGVEDVTEDEAFDLIVLDNVYEHLPDHNLACLNISRALRPGGVVYVLTPNRLWPIEAHYRLPFLSWLPVPAANVYLRLTRRGHDYTDASHAPTYWSLRRELERVGLAVSFVLPGEPSAVRGGGWHYRWGMAALRRFPTLWSVSKALLVVAVKPPRPT